jgi:hypothetical protein
MTHQRVIRFTPQFDSHAEAQGFALEQAMAWLGERGIEQSNVRAE